MILNQCHLSTVLLVVAWEFMRALGIHMARTAESLCFQRQIHLDHTIFVRITDTKWKRLRERFAEAASSNSSLLTGWPFGIQKQFENE